METMRLLFMSLTIWTTAAGSACAQQPRTDHPLWARSPPPPPPPPPIPTLATLDLTAPAKYPQFIEDMRKIFMEKGASVCTMDKMSEKAPSPRYGYIDIKASGTVTVTLAIDRTNIYVMGYSDKINQKYRAFFFNDEYNNAKDLFPEATEKDKRRYKLAYTGSYKSIGDKRSEVGLGFVNFTLSITNIYGKDYGSSSFTNHQKKFFLYAIQMISEATRFKYISQKIPTANIYDSYTPDEKMKALENGWDTLSTAIYKKTEPVTKNPIHITGCKFIQGTTTITLEDQWTFESVEEIADVIGILKSKGSRSLMINDDNDDDNGVVAVASS